jgi:DNA polymerase III alpha subunit
MSEKVNLEKFVLGNVVPDRKNEIEQNKSRFNLEVKILNQKVMLDIISFLLELQKIENRRFTNHSGFTNSSFIFYLLGLTHINPCKYDCVFERFAYTSELKNISIGLEYPSVTDFEKHSDLACEFGFKIMKENDNDYFANSNNQSYLLEYNKDLSHKRVITIFVNVSSNTQKINDLLELIGKPNLLDEINYDDPSVFKTLNLFPKIGFYEMFFQYDEDLFINFKKNSLEDIAQSIVLSINKNLDTSYRTTQEIDEKYPDFIKNILLRTDGVFIYQDQIMLALSRMMDVSLFEANTIRRNFGKRKLSEIEKTKSRFVKNSYLDESDSLKLFNKILHESIYAFAKSHVIYSAYQIYLFAWFKTFYVDLFNESFAKTN